MATDNYGFPEINPASPFNGANDINALATAIDTSMKEVELLGKAAQFELPAATPTTLGGVKPDGATVKVSGDGTISTKIEAYELPPASRGELGGVKVPLNSGFNLKPDGELSIDPKSVALPPNSVGTEQLEDSAVTTVKIAPNAVTREKLAVSLQDVIDKSSDYVTGGMTEIKLTPNSLIPGFTESSVKVYTWGPCVVVDFINAEINVSAPTAKFNVGTVNKASLPKSLKPIGFGSPNVIATESSHTFGGYCTITENGAIELTFGESLQANTYTIGGDSTMVFF